MTSAQCFRLSLLLLLTRLNDLTPLEDRSWTRSLRSLVLRKNNSILRFGIGLPVVRAAGVVGRRGIVSALVWVVRNSRMEKSTIADVMLPAVAFIDAKSGYLENYMYTDIVSS